MILDRNTLIDYPFDGTFYYMGVDESKPLTEQVEEEIIILETKCDIQGAQKEDSGVISNTYTIYFPFNKEEGIPTKLKKGESRFKGSMYGLSIYDAEVIDIIPTQLSGCVVYVRENG